MIPDLLIRRSAVAYLYQGTLATASKDNLAFYDEIMQNGVELPEMNQREQELVLLNRPNAGRAFEVRVGGMTPPTKPPPGIFVQAPFRLLISELGATRPMKFFLNSADTIYAAFQNVWGTRAGKLQLVEVSLLATAGMNHPQGAVGFLKERLSKTSTELESHLGREFDGLTIKLTSGPGFQVETGGGLSQKLPLSGASVDLTFAPSAQDAGHIALTALVKWQSVQLRLDQMQLPPELRQALGGRDFLELNAEARTPSGYVTEVYDYLDKRVRTFLSALER